MWNYKETFLLFIHYVQNNNWIVTIHYKSTLLFRIRKKITFHFFGGKKGENSEIVPIFLRYSNKSKGNSILFILNISKVENKISFQDGENLKCTFYSVMPDFEVRRMDQYKANKTCVKNWSLSKAFKSKQIFGKICESCK